MIITRATNLNIFKNIQGPVSYVADLHTCAFTSQIKYLRRVRHPYGLDHHTNVYALNHDGLDELYSRCRSRLSKKAKRVYHGTDHLAIIDFKVTLACVTNCYVVPHGYEVDSIRGTNGVGYEMVASGVLVAY